MREIECLLISCFQATNNFFKSFVFYVQRFNSLYDMMKDICMEKKKILSHFSSILSKSGVHISESKKENAKLIKKIVKRGCKNKLTT